MDLVPTASQTIGPFFHFALTAKPAACLVEGDKPGERIRIACRVLDGDGAPVTDAMIELWQADVNGFGRLETNEQGTCVFETVKPREVDACSINVSIFARGLLNRLVTRIYFDGEPANAEDHVLSLVPEDRRHTLLAHRDATDPVLWHFEIRLCSDNETVFFDV